MSGSWTEMKMPTGALYHVEVKTIDPKSADRVSFAQVKFEAVNKDNGTVTEGMLHPMWGGSGLHYAFNSGLSGDGTYEATVTVEPPAFARSMDDKDKWMKPIVAFYHFKIEAGQVVEAEVHEHISTPTTTPEATEIEIKVMAKYASFQPSTVTVPMGQMVKVTITSMDISHTFTIDELGINIAVGAGQTVTKMFTPEKMGSFAFYCAVPGHRGAGMEGTIEVTM